MCYGQFRELLLNYRKLDKDIKTLSRSNTFDTLPELLRKTKAKRRLETLILNTDDIIINQILTLRFVKGCSWVRTAARMGQHYTPDSCRMLIKRHFQKRSAADFKQFFRTINPK